MAGLNSRVILSPDVLFHMLDGEAVLLNLKSGKYFGLDEVGARIWTLLAEHSRPQIVIEQMLQEYAVDEERLRSDMMNLIDRLVANGLVSIEDFPAGR